MRFSTFRARRVAAALTAVAAVAAGGAASAAGGTTTSYAAPFQAGPSGGDQWSTYSADPASGQVYVGRASVVPAVAGCGNGSPFAKLQVSHAPTAPVTSVAVDYANAAVDPYTFLRVGVRTVSGQWLGTTAVRGPVVGNGTVDVPLDALPDGAPVEEVVVEFGLEQTGACPAADFGTVTFTAVRVTE